MDSILNTTASTFNAVGTYIKYAIGLVVSNPILLGASVLLLLTAGKSIKLGRLVSAKG